jgi:hypothetical protein
MKYFIPAIFFIAFTTRLSAQIYKADTIINERWVNNAWVLSGRIINEYNAGCQLVSVLYQVWEGSSWINSSRQTYSYISGDHTGEVIFQNWNSGTSSWDNSSKNIYTYDGSFKLLNHQVQTWAGGKWVNYFLISNTYNADGLVDQQLTQRWNGFSIWENFSRLTNSYNPDKTFHQNIEERWNGVSWENSQRTTNGYNIQGGLITTLRESWQTNNWVNFTLYNYDYNGSDQLITNTYQNWNNGSGSWITNQRYDHTYNGTGNLYQTIMQVANESNNNLLENYLRSTYHYNTNCILPLSLLDFSAALSGKDVVLKWTTTKEINTSFFEIQSSKNADNFEKIGTVKAATSSNQKITYQFVDAHASAPATGKIFYRLKMVDRDGKYSYSKIAFVGIPLEESSFSVFPNAVRDNLFVSFKFQSLTKAELRIIDQAGRQVYKQQLNPARAGSQVNINVSSLQAGTYYLELVTGEGIKTSKFIKL